MRAFLREPSTPWIVFDQEGRPPSQLAAGEVLSAPRRTLLSDYDFMRHSPTGAAQQAPVNAEPSSLCVASDVGQDDSTANGTFVAEAPIVVPMHAGTRRVLGVAAAFVCAASLVAVGAFALRASSRDAGVLPTAVAAQPAQRAAAVTARVEAPAADLSAPATAPAKPDAAPVEGATAKHAAAPEAAPREEAKSGAKKLGRLSIAGHARTQHVFMDGKRMLGHGARHFTVVCGTHAIAVGSRSDAREVEIPCNGEFVVTK